MKLMAAKFSSWLRQREFKWYFESPSHSWLWHDHNEMKPFGRYQFSVAFCKSLSSDSLQGHF